MDSASGAFAKLVNVPPVGGFRILTSHRLSKDNTLRIVVCSRGQLAGTVIGRRRLVVSITDPAQAGKVELPQPGSNQLLDTLVLAFADLDPADLQETWGELIAPYQRSADELIMTREIAIEAAIGSLKTRTQQQAEQAGHPDCWTATDVEAARRQANATARPKRLRGQTPDQVWAKRSWLTADQRGRFRATVQRFREEARAEQDLPLDGALSHWQQAVVDRVALRRALVAHDLLVFRRRRILAPIRRLQLTSKG